MLELSLRTLRIAAPSTRNHSRTVVGLSWSIGHYCAGFILCCKNTSGTGFHKASSELVSGRALRASRMRKDYSAPPLSRLTFVVGCPVWRSSRSSGVAPQSSGRSIEISSLIIGPDKALLRGGQRVRVLRRGGGLIGGSEGEGVRDCYCLTMTRTVVSSRSARLAFIKACVDWKQTITKNAEECVICGRDLGRDTHTIV